jgi:hypothetical protein
LIRVVEIETTGLDPATDPIIEIASVDVVRGGGIIYRYFSSHRRLVARADRESTTHRRSEPKIGRNDPCPCGSGQKFKKCCGKVTLH